MTALVNKAFDIMILAHHGTTDKAGKLYWMHSCQVMNMLTDATEEEKAVALLHDVLEDTPITAEDLKRMGFPSIVVKAVELLTRQPGVSYLDYIARLAAGRGEAAAIAVKVKIADLKDNLNPNRPDFLGRDKLIDRYTKALAILAQK